MHDIFDLRFFRSRLVPCQLALCCVLQLGLLACLLLAFVSHLRIGAVAIEEFLWAPFCSLLHSLRRNSCFWVSGVGALGLTT